MHKLAFVAVAVLAVGCAGDGSESRGGPEGYETGADGGAWPSQDAGAGGSNISLGGAEDFGYFRRLLDDGVVPSPGDLEAAGFFAEHFIGLPPPTCGERICLATPLGIMGNLIDGSSLAVVQLGLNTPVTLDTSTRPPFSLAVSVDVSGSMAEGGKIDYVREGLTTLISQLADTDRMTLVAYSDEATVLAPMAPLAESRAELLAIADDLVADSGTNFYDGLKLAYEHARLGFDVERQNRVILLSDGQPTVGNTSEADILAMSATYNAEGIGITTIGLGTGFNAPLMRGLAEQGYGSHYFLEDTSAIDDVFIEELSYFLTPVAFDVTLTVDARSDFHFANAYGSPFWNDTPEGGQVSVPSVFIAHRQADTDVGPSGGRRGGGSALLLELEPLADSATSGGPGSSAVARVDVSFREPGASEKTRSTVWVSYPHAASELEPRGYFAGGDPAMVQKSFLVLNLYLALAKACEQYAAGERTPAIATLLRVKAAAEDYNDSAKDGVGDLDIASDIELFAQLVSVMQANGAVPPETVDIPADPWPAD